MFIYLVRCTCQVKSIDVSDKVQGKEVVIFWGSQSGRSERLAKALARECQRRCGIRALAADLDDYDHQHLAAMPDNKYVGFVVSTFGEGDPSDNAVGLYEYLIGLGQNGQQQRQLSNLRYFAFGLGNTKYQHFNKFVDMVQENLDNAGARRLGSVGKEDEALRDDNSWATWKESIMVELAKALGKDTPVRQQEDVYEADFAVVEHSPDAPAGKGQFIYMGEHTQSSISPIKEARLLSRPASSSSGLPRDYIHIEFDIGNNPSALSYRSGDHVAVWPMNAEEEVQRLVRLFGWNDETLNAVIDIKPRDGDDDDFQTPPVPTPTTRGALLRHYLDIGGAASRATIQVLAHFAPTSTAKGYLKAMLADKNGSGMTSYWTIGRLMQSADPASTAIWPAALFDLLIQHLPLLQPRYFSIASSPAVQSRRLAITVAVVVAEVPSQNNKTENFYGVTTNYLYSLYQEHGKAGRKIKASLQNQNDDISDSQTLLTTRPRYALSGPRNSLSGGKAFIQIRPSPFKLPDDPRRPILLMAAGSGIAPFRAFVQERVQTALAGRRHEHEVGRILLFFGCRSAEEDFLYEEEWKDIREKLSSNANKSLFELDCAFSRPADKKEKAYVQDRVLARRDDVLKLLLEEQASWYICGRIQLATGVKSVVKQILSETQGWTAERSEEYIEELKRSGRLKEDVWA